MSGLGGAGASSPPLAGVLCRVMNRTPVSPGGAGSGSMWFWFNVRLGRGGGLFLLLVGNVNFDCEIPKHFSLIVLIFVQPFTWQWKPVTLAF